MLRRYEIELFFYDDDGVNAVADLGPIRATLTIADEFEDHVHVGDRAYGVLGKHHPKFPWLVCKRATVKAIPPDSESDTPLIVDG